MTSYHTPTGTAIDITLTASAHNYLTGLTTVMEQAREAASILVGKGTLFWAPLPVRPPSSSADRTRSPRWRAGTRRARKMALKAKRQGRRSPLKPAPSSWAGWEPLGWTDDEGLGWTHES